MKTKSTIIPVLIVAGIISFGTLSGQTYGSGLVTNNCATVAGTAGAGSTFYGCGSGSAIVTASGINNTFIGGSAGLSNTYARENVALGFEALRTQSYANGNTAWNTYNVAIGNQALYSNQPTSSTNGYQNIAVGYQAAYSNTTGTNNTFMGHKSGYSNTSGDYGLFLGELSGYSNTTGDYNHFIGGAAGYYNTTGYYNTFTGYTCGYRNSTGYHNTFMGHQAGHENTTGYSNSYFGLNAGYANTVGIQNTAIGNLSGDSYAADTNCTFLGYGADANATGMKNSTAVGYNTIATASNQVRLGDGNITTMFCIGAYNGTSASSTNMVVLNTGQICRSTSSARYKKDIVDLEVKTSKIYELRPVSYTSTSPYDNNMRQFGLIAEEVAKTIPELAYYAREKDVIPGSTSEKLIPDAVQYPLLAVLLLKEVQKHEAVTKAQQAEITETKKAIEAAREENAAMKTQLAQLDKALAQCCLNYQQSAPGKAPVTGSLNDAPALEQNVPNPFHENTIIRFYLPATAQSAVLKIYSLEGKELKAFGISQTGNGSVTIEGNSIAAGTYNYMLIIDGKVVDSKMMVLSK
ncbi:MAG: hypothetical protein FD123_2355 [Bacteroidetes bacterium]|nr:MAG: hypothetical protein FD123_2355 [Bacteroidota bacterium]